MAYVDRTEFNSGTTATTSQATTLPSYSAGDVLILGLAGTNFSPVTIGGLGAWTALPNGSINNANGSFPSLRVYRLITVGGESAPTITFSTARRNVGFIASFSGRDAATLIDADHITGNAASANATETAGITIADAGDDVLFIGSTQNTTTWTAPTTPGTWTQRAYQSTGGVTANDATIFLATSTQAAGATGAVTAVLTASRINNAYLLGLLPSGAPSGQPMALRLAGGQAPGVWYPGRG